jgi:epoxyqueuosine reductase
VTESECQALGSAIRDKASALGFDLCGFARADVPLEAEYDRYRAFLDEGMHGTMAYLAEHAEVRQRLDTGDILRGAKSVICVARRYQRSREAESHDPPVAQRIARYARGRDYHNVVRKKLRQLAAFLRTLSHDGERGKARPMCDDIPVLERAWACRAGLGFIGKNGLLIAPGVGSFVLLGEVVTTLPLPYAEPMAERCGSCTRCLDACPTQAFERPFVLDPRKCIAYLTIERRGEIPEPQRESLGEHLFGCDDCQTVCPFNAGEKPGADEAAHWFTPLPLWQETTETTLLEMTEAAWQARSLGSPVKRAEVEGIARNAAIVLGNQRNPDSRPALERAAGNHPSAVVRDAAAWALTRIRAQR